MALKSNILNTAILGIILLVVLFQCYAAIMPTSQAAGNSMNDTARCNAAGGTYCANLTTPYCYSVATCNSTVGNPTVAYNQIPLSSLFSGTGVLFVVIMAALLILVVKAFLPGGKK